MTRFKVLRGEKGDQVLEALKWAYQHKRTGDIFHQLPSVMKTSFHILVWHASNQSEWLSYCDNIKPVPWVNYGNNGIRGRMSKRLAQKRSNERSLKRMELRRQLRGARGAMGNWVPAPVQNEFHVYTDGAASIKRGLWKAGCGVWFLNDQSHNICTRPRGKQTNNRAELTAVILALRKSLQVMDRKLKLVIFSDSKYCIDGINISMRSWKIEGWTRKGKPLRNTDLWKVLDRALNAISNANVQVEFKHVLAHVGIYGNEQADKLAKTVMEKGHRLVPQTASQALDLALDKIADDIVDACLVSMYRD